jgi:hypothetical protein
VLPAQPRGEQHALQLQEQQVGAVQRGAVVVLPTAPTIHLSVQAGQGHRLVGPLPPGERSSQ